MKQINDEGIQDVVKYTNVPAIDRAFCDNAIASGLANLLVEKERYSAWIRDNWRDGPSVF